MMFQQQYKRYSTSLHILLPSLDIACNEFHEPVHPKEFQVHFPRRYYIQRPKEMLYTRELQVQHVLLVFHLVFRLGNQLNLRSLGSG
jgi:hypothetical protein